MSLTSVFAEMDTLVVFERAKVAVSVEAFGTVIAVQLAAVLSRPIRD